MWYDGCVHDFISWILSQCHRRMNASLFNFNGHVSAIQIKELEFSKSVIGPMSLININTWSKRKHSISQSVNTYVQYQMLLS